MRHDADDQLPWFSYQDTHIVHAQGGSGPFCDVRFDADEVRRARAQHSRQETEIQRLRRDVDQLRKLAQELTQPSSRPGRAVETLDGGGRRNLIVTVVPPSLCPVSWDGTTALHRAANSGDKLTIQGLLLDIRLDIHAKDNNGRKAVWYASLWQAAQRHGEGADILALLAARSGVDPEWVMRVCNDLSPDKWRQTFFDAVIKGDGAMVQFVLDIGGNISWRSGGLNVRWSYCDAPALHYANWYRWKHVCDLLVSNGASKTAVDGHGNLLTAASWGGDQGLV